MSFRIAIKAALSEAGLPSDKQDAFCLWAFGDGWESAPLSSTDDRWNERHGDVMHVRPDDDLIQTLVKMAKLYGEGKYEQPSQR